MFTFIKSILVIVFGLVFGLGAFLAPAANADEPTVPTPVVDITSDQASVPDPEAKIIALKVNAAEKSASPTSVEEPPTCEGVDMEVGTGDCADVVASESHSRSSSSSKVVAVNGVSLTSSVTVLANIKANGTPKSQQTNCRRIKKAMSLWTSYNAEGTTGWRWKFYPKWKRFCRINDVVRDPICHNQVKFGVPRSRPPKNAIFGQVKFVKRLVWEAKATAKADEKVTSEAHAWCNTATSRGRGSGWASASAYAVGHASLSGWVRTTLLARVRATAQGDLRAKLGGKSVATIKGEVRASTFTKATTEAWALAECTQPPPVYDQPDVDVTPVACVNPGQTRNVTVTVFNPNENTTDETATLTFPGKTPETKAIASPGPVTFTLSNVGAGTYSGSVRLNKAAKSKSFTVTVEECPPVVRDKPSIDLTVEACVPGATVLDVSAVVGNPNDDPSGGTIKFGSRSPVTFGSIPVGGSSAPIVFQNVSPGTYTVTATLTAFNTTATTQVVVPNCPPVQPPVFVQFGEFNDLEVNWTSNHCVTVDTPAGHTATVYWDATFGSFAAPQKTAQDGVQICSTYKAPSEVPAGGTDRITVRAVDNVTDLSVTKTTEPFMIHPTAPHPE
jgi:hypothetical protein